MKPRRTKKNPFAVGTKVRFKFGGRRVTATVIEDRGNLGVGGTQILRIRLPISGTDQVMEFEIPAADVTVAA